VALQVKRGWSRHWRLLALLVGRELKVKYRGSVLGYFWSMLNPLLFMTIISFVLGRLMRGIEHYEIYVLSGILFWNMTVIAVVGATHSLVGNAGLLRKVRVPYWVFVLVPIGAAVANFGLALAPYLLVTLIRGVPLQPQFLAVPLLLVVYAAFLAGIGTVLAIANVYFRDVSHVIEPLLQLCFYATPIIYDRRTAGLPDWAARLLELNPLTQFVDLMRAALFSPDWFSWHAVAYAIACASVSLIIGMVFYRRSVDRLSFRI
jgi:ABC-type polysaccharide/polyol phosphate export permease